MGRLIALLLAALAAYMAVVALLDNGRLAQELQQRNDAVALAQAEAAKAVALAQAAQARAQERQAEAAKTAAVAQAWAEFAGELPTLGLVAALGLSNLVALALLALRRAP